MNNRNDSGGALVGQLCRVGMGLAVVISMGCPVFAQEDSGREVRWHDLRALLTVGVQDPEGVDLRLHLGAAYLDNLEPDHWDVDLERPFRQDSDDWMELIREALPGTSVEMEVQSGMLRVVAEKGVQGQVAGILADMKGQFLRSVDFEVFVLPANSVAAGTPSILTAAEVTNLLASGDALDGSRKTARLGQRLVLGSEGRAAAMTNYDVEVASKARAADPGVTVLREGLSLGAIARSRPGGGFFLRVWGRRGALEEPIRTVRLGHFAGAPLELPAMQTMLSVASGSIADGGGLLVGQDWNGQGIWLIRASSSGPVVRSRSQSSLFIPLGQLAARPLLVEPPRLPQTDPSGGWHYPDGSILTSMGDDPFEQFCDLDEFVSRLNDERDHFDLGGAVILLGDCLYVRGSSALQELALRRVDELTRALIQETAQVEVRYGILDGKLARRLASESSATDIAATLEHRVVGACRLGDSLIVLGGVERFYLKDHDTEIAEASVIQDPVIGNRFEGASFWCRPVRAMEGVLSLTLDFAVQTEARETRELPAAFWSPRKPEQSEDDPTPTGTFQLDSAIELPATARADVRSAIQLTEGEWTLLCCTGLAGTDSSLVAVVRASAK